MFNRILILVLLFWILLPLQTATASSPQNPLLTSDSVYLSKQGIHKFNRGNLELEWLSLIGVRTFEPVIKDGFIFVGSTEGLYALHAATGKIAWHVESEKTIFSPAIDKQIFAGSLHGELYSINPDDGKINWRQQLSGWIYSPVVLADLDQLWSGGESHEAFLFDIKTGVILNRVELEQEAIYSPQRLDQARIVFNLFSGNSVIINVHTEAPVSRLDGSSQPRHLSFDRNTIYRTNRDGSLIAFDKLSNEIIWNRNIVAHDLSMHPVTDGYMLLTDLDHMMVLLNLESNEVVFKIKIDGAWFSPIQIDENHIVYFQSESTQPNQIRAVRFDAWDT